MLNSLKFKCAKAFYRNAHVLWGALVIFIVTFFTGAFVSSVVGCAAGLAIASLITRGI